MLFIRMTANWDFKGTGCGMSVVVGLATRNAATRESVAHVWVSVYPVSSTFSFHVKHKRRHVIWEQWRYHPFFATTWWRGFMCPVCSGHDCAQTLIVSFVES